MAAFERMWTIMPQNLLMQQSSKLGPRLPMMETIRRQAMARISKRKEKARRWKKKISEYVSDILEEELERAMKCEVTKGTHGKFEVWIDGSSNFVNLTKEEWDWSCCKWPITGIPCEHAYAAIMDASKDVEDFVVPMWSIVMWREQYETAPNPVRGQMYWPTDYALITAPEDPVPLGRKKGQKNYNRIKGKLESPKKKKDGPEVQKLGRHGRIMHCGSCKETGHNAAGCKKFPKEKKGKKKTNQEEEVCITIWSVSLCISVCN